MSSWEESISKVFHRFRLDSIKSKILVFALFATLIPSLVTTWVSYAENKRSLTEKTTEELQSAGIQAAREVDLWLKERLYDLRVFSSSYEVSENLERLATAPARSSERLQALSRLKEYLRSVQEPFADYEELLVFSSEGRVVATGERRGGTGDALETGGTGATISVLPQPFVDSVLVAQTAHTKAAWDSALGKPVMRIAVPIRAADDRFLGALAAILNLETVDGILARFVPGTAGEVYVITEAGNPIVSSRTASADLQHTEPTRATVAALFDSTVKAVSYTDYRGEAVVGTGARVPGMDWAVVAQIPSSEAFAQVARLRNVSALLLLALLVGVGLLAYGLGLSIVRPLNRLTHGASQVAGGNLAVDVPVLGGGEVGYLTEVFNDMVGRLRKGREELASINETLAAQNEKLERLSITDGLTGLYNHRHMMDTLTQEAQRSRRQQHPLSVILLDVDHFKRFNDTHGHQAGDEALKRVAALLAEATREVDCLARYGGEEFLIMLPETDLAGAAEVAERIRSRVASEPFTVGRNYTTVTLSVGVAEFPIDGDEPTSVIACADAALYRAKREGRNCVVTARETSIEVQKEA